MANATFSSLPRRRRWPWVLLALSLLLWFLPWIVANTGLFDWIVGKATGSLKGRLVVKQASLGWFSPIVLGEVELQDEQGQAIVSVERLETHKTLWSFLWGRQDLGVVRITRANLNLVVDAGSTNLEAVLAPLLARPAEPSAGPGSSLIVEIKNATILLAEKGRRPTRLEVLDLTLALNASEQAPFEMTLNARDAQQGQLSARLSERKDPSDTLPWHLELEARRFSLGTFNAFLARSGIAERIDGDLSGKLNAQWSGDGALRAELTSSLVLHNGSLETPALPDRLALKMLDLPARLNVAGNRIEARSLVIASDLGIASFQGQIDLDDWQASLQRHPLQARAEIDLVQLSEKLPRTLRLHKDLALTSGTIHLQASSKVVEGGMHWNGSLSASGLKGRRGTREVTWSDAIQASGEMKVSSKGVELDQLQCQSGFLKVQGRGNAGAFQVQAEADLDRLTTSLVDFIDLGAVKLKGQARFTAAVSSPGANVRHAKAEALVQGWHIHWPGLAPWQEEKASVKAEAGGVVNDAGIRLSAASVKWESGSDRAHAVLLNPVELARIQTSGWSVVFQGDLQRWQHRLEIITGPWTGWRIAGFGDIKGNVLAHADAWKLSNLSFLVSDARIVGPGVWINEPTLDLEGQATYTAGLLQWERAQLRCPAVNVNAANVVIDWRERFEMAAGVSLSADVSRLRRWFLDPSVTAPMPLHGLAIGQMGIRQRQGSLAFDANVTVQNLVVGSAADPILRDPNLKLHARGGWDFTKDSCSFDELALEGQMLSCKAQGKMDQLASAGRIELRGMLSYDLKKMEPLLRSYLGKDALVEGKGQREFQLSGTLFQPAVAMGVKAGSGPSLTGQASFHWDRLSAYRCDIGKAEARVALEKGWITLAPLESTLNSGKLHLQARMKVSPGPAELHLPRMKVVERAQVTPAMCSGALGYALPALAGVTQAEGLLSLELEHGYMPLDRPNSSDVRGVLTLHDVRIGPSPLLRELSLLLKGPAPARLQKEARVTVHLTKERVHHDKLELIFPEFTIRTSGWVGLDGTLGLIAEVPVSGSWVGGDRLGKVLEGQVIQVPISGTLESPRLDQKAFQSALARLVRDTSGAVLRNELEERLKKLLTPRGK